MKLTSAMQISTCFKTSQQQETERTGVALKLLARIRQVSDSNLGYGIGSYLVIHDFPQFIKASAGIVPRIDHSRRFYPT
jgi:hypothetical protein